VTLRDRMSVKGALRVHAGEFTRASRRALVGSGIPKPFGYLPAEGIANYGRTQTTEYKQVDYELRLTLPPAYTQLPLQRTRFLRNEVPRRGNGRHGAWAGAKRGEKTKPTSGRPAVSLFCETKHGPTTCPRTMRLRLQLRSPAHDLCGRTQNTEYGQISS